MFISVRRWHDVVGIGIITRNRYEYLERCVDSLFDNNSYLMDYPLVIGDDASDKDVLSKTQSKYCCYTDWDENYILHFRKQRGMSANIKQVVDLCEAYLNLKYLFFTVNDFYNTREIDFPALLKFMDENPKVGQIQMVHYKGVLGDPKRERHAFNWTSGEPEKFGDWKQVGKERLRKTNYSFVNLPAITRLHQCDITRGTIERERRKGERPEKYIQNIELRWVKNWYDTGLENWEIDPATQPFLGMDVDMKNQTDGIKA